MVCEKCTKNLSKLAAPDPFSSTNSQVASGSRRISGTLYKPKKFSPYGGKPGGKPGGKALPDGKCKDCKQEVSQNTARYCHGCAYKKGICCMCGKKILDTKGYVMSNK